jgi:4-hydroxy-tetrahydrodipicolinate synthase
VQFSGSIPALVTPFQPGGALDIVAFEALLDWHVESGSSAVVVGGSTGESGALESLELAALISAAVRRLRGKIPVIAGVGAPATAKSLALIRLAHDAGADAVLAVTPYYCRPTQDGLRAHFEALASGPLPVILYNVPSRTGVDLLPDTVAQLAALKSIVAIKEAVPVAERWRALIALQRPDFSVLSGDDGTALAAIADGARGLISVAANAQPAAYAELIAAGLAGRTAEANAIDAMLAPLNEALAAAPNPIAIKAALALMGRIEDVLRLPLQPLEAAHRPALAASLAAVSGWRRAA